MSCPAVVRVTVAGGPAAVRVPVSTGPAVVRVVAPGPQGPPGPPGSALSTYTHQQTSPSSTWTINHNLGFRPSVELLSSGSKEIEGDVAHTSTNQVVVQFTAAITGIARLV